MYRITGRRSAVADNTVILLRNGLIAATVPPSKRAITSGAGARPRCLFSAPAPRYARRESRITAGGRRKAERAPPRAVCAGDGAIKGHPPAEARARIPFSRSRRGRFYRATLRLWGEITRRQKRPATLCSPGRRARARRKFIASPAAIVEYLDVLSGGEGVCKSGGTAGVAGCDRGMRGMLRGSAVDG